MWRDRLFLVRWLGVVLALWTLSHLLARGIGLDEYGTALRFVGWTSLKIVAWLIPTWVLMRRHGQGSLARLGIDTACGIWGALIFCAAWIAFQAGGVALHLPLFQPPTPLPDGYALLATLLVAPLFEELMFRGAMLQVLREGGVPRELAVLANGLGFAALHLPGWIARRGLDGSIFGSFVSMVFFGINAGYLRWRSPTFWSPVLFHLANNLYATGTLGYLTDRLCDLIA